MKLGGNEMNRVNILHIIMFALGDLVVEHGWPWWIFDAWVEIVVRDDMALRYRSDTELYLKSRGRVVHHEVVK